jgi:hypothetical protein
MKTFIRLFIISLVVLSIIATYSCEKSNSDNTGTGKAEFSISLPTNAVTRSASLDDSITLSYQVMITVEDPDGNAVLTDNLIPIYLSGTEYVSENIEIKPGEFRLTKFLVINPAGEVISAAPVSGSPLSSQSKLPLPCSFSILREQVTRILPGTISVDDQSSDKFGYTSFGIQILNPLDFYTVCIIDNPLSMTAMQQRTSAMLTVFASNGWHYKFRLEPFVNHLVIRGGTNVYTFVVEKEGYPAQKFQFTAKELEETSRENPLVLKIPWDSQYKTLVLQPGPEKGKDAMITNLEPDKNFGGYKYFETTFLSEPVLTVMRSNRSLIWFDRNALPKSAIIKKVTLQLWYDVPIPFAGTYLTDVYPSATIKWYGGVLQQITEPWDEYKVTWNTQPKTIEANQVYIPPFIRNVNFIEINVTSLFVPVEKINAPNYGMLFRLWPSEQFPGFRFASGDYSDPKMWPKLTIYYTL